MKYKIALLLLLFLGCSKPEPKPEHAQQSNKEIELEELQEKIRETIEKESTPHGGNNPPNPEYPRIREQLEAKYRKIKKNKY